MRKLHPVALPFALLTVIATACDDPAPPPVEIAPPAAEPKKAPPPGVGSASQPSAAALGKEVKAADGTVMKSFELPGGTIEAPSAWNPKLRQDPPMMALHVMPTPGMTCDIAVLKGHGSRKEAEEYLRAGAKAYAGQEERAPDAVVGGNTFQGIRITKPKSFRDNPNAIVEVYASLSGDDLLGIGVTRLEPSDQQAAARGSCMEAFARYTSKLPNSAAEQAPLAPGATESAPAPNAPPTKTTPTK